MNKTKNWLLILLPVFGRSRLPLFALFLLTILFLISPLNAGENKNKDDVSFEEILEMSLDELLALPITIASTKGETLMQSSSTVTIIDREMLERFSFRDLASAVEFIGGVNSYRNYFNQHIITVRRILQDGYTNKNLLMIDGIPTFASVAGETTFDRINLRDVERIEILKGPASVLYGTQAYTGAFNVVLRHSKENSRSINVFAGGGNNGAYSFGANFRINKSGLKALVSASATNSHRHAYSFVGENGDTVDSKTYIDTQIFTGSLSIGAHKFLLNIHRHDDDYLGVTPSVHRGAGENVRYEGLLASYGYNHKWNETNESRLQLYYDWNTRDYPRDNLDELRAHAAGYRLGATLRNLLKVNENIHLEIGGAYDYRKSKELSNYLVDTNENISFNNMNDKEVYEYSAYAQLEWKLAPFQLVVGSRYTGNEFFGNNLSTRAALVYAITPGNVLKLIAGQSYRSPNLFELNFMTAQKTIFGNPDLKPETSDVLELVYQYGKGNVFLQVGGFLARYDNKIFRRNGDAYDPDGNLHQDVNVYANGEQFTSYGLEIEFKLLNPKLFNFYLNADYIHGNDGDRVFDDRSSYGLPGTYYFNFKSAPKFTLSAGIHRRWGKLGAAAKVMHVGKTDGPYLPEPGHTLVDLELDYRHTVGGVRLKHGVSISNLLGDETWYPEYVRRRVVNAIPGLTKIGFFYSLTVNLETNSR
ncbi:MAG: TonB-dependent receptor [bacterium]|nr:TonB-dependent receptor [bacterium]